MNIQRMSVFGTDNIGVYIFSNNKYTLVPRNLDKQAKEIIKENLNTKIIEFTIADSFLIGIFLAGNNNCIIMPRIAKEEEFRLIKEVAKDVRVEKVDVRATALGNVILANDKAALVYPEFSDAEVKILKEVLEVEEIKKGTIAQVIVVGSAGVVTSKGGLVHIDATESEVKELGQLFGTKIEVGTVNFGNALVRSGMVANDNGVLVGTSTTGPEILRMQRAFGE